ncbi:MAG: hypothetical protein J3K34DRAFT_440821 [Monoraphidium minutum]|nr:MAG: hypothetical protein J3K34DRAFT_440821 [Monoraphidium minutum]
MSCGARQHLGKRLVLAAGYCSVLVAAWGCPSIGWGAALGRRGRAGLGPCPEHMSSRQIVAQQTQTLPPKIKGGSDSTRSRSVSRVGMRVSSAGHPVGSSIC